MKRIKSILSTKKHLALVAAALVVVACAGFYFWGDSASAAPYMTSRVERGNLRNTVTATGTLQAVTTVQVGSQVSGTISNLYADFNSVVKKGQVIAQLDPSITKAQVEQARANLQQAQAQLQQARASVAQTHAGVAVSRAGVSDARARALAAASTTQNQQAGVASAQANVDVLKAQLDDAASYMRQEQALLQNGVIAQREYDTAMTGYKTAEAKYNQGLAQLNMAKLSADSASSAGQAQASAQVEQAQAQTQQSQGQAQGAQASVQNAEAQVQQATAALQLAELNLQHTTIASPIDGIVVDRPVSVGQTVAASLQAPTLFTIAQDLTQMQVMANIDQADIGLVQQAKGASFTVDAFPGQDFKGTIEQIRLNPQTVQNVVTYNVVIGVSNPDQKLKPGMTANLTITIDERNNVVKVPNSALRFMPQSSDVSDAARGNGGGQGSRRNANRQAGGEQGNGAGDAANASTDGSAQQGDRAQFAPSTAPVLPGQLRRIWVLGPDGKPQPRRIKVGLTDGTSTEVVEGDIHEGDTVVTGQNLTSASKSQGGGAQTQSPFGGAPRVGGGGAPRGR